MQKHRRHLSYVMTLLAIATTTACTRIHAQSESGTSKKEKDWTKDPEWVKTRYGGWGGPGVNPGAGPMDDVRLKDYAPKSSLVIRETTINKARFPAIDVHAHINARAPQEVADWVRTMDEAGVERTVILTGATGAQFDKLVELYF